eukprot:GFYU01002404.1.p1 GENE.GFYU01002404.1~~GFYU01002404.1.p1  ORF type:complete len:1126 (+),score=323.88 GFYU01002404.1:810-4187(+)
MSPLAVGRGVSRADGFRTAPVAVPLATPSSSLVTATVDIMSTTPPTASDSLLMARTSTVAATDMSRTRTEVCGDTGDSDGEADSGSESEGSDASEGEGEGQELDMDDMYCIPVHTKNEGRNVRGVPRLEGLDTLSQSRQHSAGAVKPPATSALTQQLQMHQDDAPSTYTSTSTTSVVAGGDGGKSRKLSTESSVVGPRSAASSVASSYQPSHHHRVSVDTVDSDVYDTSSRAGSFMEAVGEGEGGGEARGDGAKELGHEEDDVYTWLKTLGLDRYADRFQEHLITLEHLPLLNETALQLMHIPLGPSLQILSAINDLGDSMPLPSTVGTRPHSASTNSSSGASRSSSSAGSRGIPIPGRGNQYRGSWGRELVNRNGANAREQHQRQQTGYRNSWGHPSSTGAAAGRSRDHRDHHSHLAEEFDLEDADHDKSIASTVSSLCTSPMSVQFEGDDMDVSLAHNTHQYSRSAPTGGQMTQSRQPYRPEALSGVFSSSQQSLDVDDTESVCAAPSAGSHYAYTSKFFNETEYTYRKRFELSSKRRFVSDVDSTAQGRDINTGKRVLMHFHSTVTGHESHHRIFTRLKDLPSSSKYVASLLEAHSPDGDLDERGCLIQENGEYSLDDYLRTETLNGYQQKDIIYQLLEVVKFLHRFDLVHGNLQPSSFGKYGTQWKLQDLSCLLWGHESPVPPTSTDDDGGDVPLGENFGAGLGRMKWPRQWIQSYGCPEFALAAITNPKTLSVDKGYDIWNFGLLVWEIVTGYPMFAEPPHLLEIACDTEIEIDDEAFVDHRVVELIQGCLRKKIADRFTLTDIVECDFMSDQYHGVGPLASSANTGSGSSRKSVDVSVTSTLSGASSASAVQKAASLNKALVEMSQTQRNIEGLAQSIDQKQHTLVQGQQYMVNMLHSIYNMTEKTLDRIEAGDIVVTLTVFKKAKNGTYHKQVFIDSKTDMPTFLLWKAREYKVEVTMTTTNGQALPVKKCSMMCLSGVRIAGPSRKSSTSSHSIKLSLIPEASTFADSPNALTFSAVLDLTNTTLPELRDVTSPDSVVKLNLEMMFELKGPSSNFNARLSGALHKTLQIRVVSKHATFPLKSMKGMYDDLPNPVKKTLKTAGKVACGLAFVVKKIVF